MRNDGKETFGTYAVGVGCCLLQTLLGIGTTAASILLVLWVIGLI